MNFLKCNVHFRLIALVVAIVIGVVAFIIFGNSGDQGVDYNEENFVVEY